MSLDASTGRAWLLPAFKGVQNKSCSLSTPSNKEARSADLDRMWQDGHPDSLLTNLFSLFYPLTWKQAQTSARLAASTFSLLHQAVAVENACNVVMDRSLVADPFHVLRTTTLDCYPFFLWPTEMYIEDGCRCLGFAPLGASHTRR